MDISEGSLITIRRRGSAKIAGYKFAKTARGELPGIQSKKEKFQECESGMNHKNYSKIQLNFHEKTGELFAIYRNECVRIIDVQCRSTDFKSFRDCYGRLNKAGGRART